MVVGQLLITPTVEICIQQLGRVEEMVWLRYIRNVEHALSLCVARVCQRQRRLLCYPRDAVLTRYQLWLHVCMSVCPSQAGVLVLSQRLNRSIWVLALSLPSSDPTLCYMRIRLPSKIRVLPSGTFFTNSGFRKIPQLLVDRPLCCQLSSTRRPSPVYHTKRSTLCTTPRVYGLFTGGHFTGGLFTGN